MILAHLLFCVVAEYRGGCELSRLFRLPFWVLCMHFSLALSTCVPARVALPPRFQRDALSRSLDPTAAEPPPWHSRNFLPPPSLNVFLDFVRRAVGGGGDRGKTSTGC